jgi:uncharacterized protein YkwD
MLAAHNAVRQRVKVRALTWSDGLAERAQAWADTLLRQREFVHSSRNPYGENLFEIMGAPATPAQVVADWASEEVNYDYRANQCHGVCGHYTQIVWRETRQVGCGVARSSGREVWVCEYQPRGNWVGRRPY